MSNGGVIVVVSGKDDTEAVFKQIEAHLDRVRVSADATAVAGRRAGTELAESFGAAVPEITAASAAVRALEGNLSIRATERFLSTTLGLKDVLIKAFPVVGALALADAVYKGYEDLKKLRDEALAAGAALVRAFEDAVSAERKHVDELTLTNDKLQETLDKLEGKPRNGLAVGLDEGRVAADNLYDSLTKDVDALTKLNDQTKVSIWEKIFGRTADASDVTNIVSGATAKLDEIKNSYQDTLNSAEADGATGKNLDEIKQAELARLQDAYSNAEAKLKPLLARLRQEQQDFEAPFSVGRDHSKEIAAATGALDLFAEQQKELGEQYRNSQLAPAVAAAQANRPDDKQAHKLEAAQKAFDAAMLALQQAHDKEQGEQEKAAADARLAAIGDLHKRELISDEIFYKKRAALQDASIGAQQKALLDQETDLIRRIGTLRTERPKDDADAVERNTKIVQLEQKFVELQGQSARLTAEQAKNVGDLASSLDSVADKKQALSDELAAKREAIGGASVDARLKQSRDAFSHKRDDLAVIFGANSAEVANADAVQANAENTIRAQGAEASYSTDAATIAAQKSAIQNAARRGAINGITERQQLIELDREEAAALQPVLAAYEKLAAGGDLAATNKVIELKSKINDLENPINEVAAHGRQQFDSIFESMFDNLDKGQRGWAQLNQQIQHMLLTDAYKAYLEPMVQALAGAAIPNNPRAPHGQVASLGHLGGVGAILGGMIPGLGKIPSVGKVSGGAGDVTVQIINQGTPMESAGAMQKMGGDESGFSDRVISVILKDAETNGAGIQAILGALNV